MEPSTTNPVRKAWQSIFINIALALYAVSTFISALLKGEAWRIVISGVGSVFFIVMVITLAVKLNKLRKLD